MGMEPEDRQEDLKFKVDVRRNLRNLYSMVKPYRWRFIALLAVILVIEASYVLEKYLFKLIIDNGTEYATGTLSADPFLVILGIVATVFAVMLVVRTVLKFVHIHFINKLDSGLIVDLKKRFFNHLIHLSHRFHTTNKTGSMISRMSRGGRSVEALVDVIVFNFAPMTFLFIVAAAALLTVNVTSAIVITVMIVVFLGWGLIIQNKQMDLHVLANHKEDVEKAVMADYFTNIESIKYYGKEKTVKRNFLGLTHQTRDAFYRLWGYFRWLDAGHAFILGLGAFFVVALPIMDLLNGKATVGDVAFIYTVYTSLLGPLFGFMHGIRNFTRSMADFESIFEYEKYENEIKDKHDSKVLKVRKGKIEFRDMGFKYYKRFVFRNFNLKIEPNQKVAFVGHSGSGKSTLVKLLYRLYDVDEGSILIDNKDIRNLKQDSLRAELSIVPQESVLFDDTIWNNIRFSNPTASREQVWKAIKFAQLDKVIVDMPKKEYTIVGERGVRLSGGEKQRVGIARALLANKKILVLDEATSALDSETEHEIQKDLERLMEGRTSLIIAHRLSTIMHADKIVVLDKGNIVQVGKHSHLIKQEGQYKKLWNLQKGGYVK